MLFLSKNKKRWIILISKKTLKKNINNLCDILNIKSKVSKKIFKKILLNSQNFKNFVNLYIIYNTDKNKYIVELTYSYKINDFKKEKEIKDMIVNKLKKLNFKVKTLNISCDKIISNYKYKRIYIIVNNLDLRKLVNFNEVKISNNIHPDNIEDIGTYIEFSNEKKILKLKHFYWNENRKRKKDINYLGVYFEKNEFNFYHLSNLYEIAFKKTKPYSTGMILEEDSEEESLLFYLIKRNLSNKIKSIQITKLKPNKYKISLIDKDFIKINIYQFEKGNRTIIKNVMFYNYKKYNLIPIKICKKGLYFFYRYKDKGLYKLLINAQLKRKIVNEDKFKSYLNNPIKLFQDIIEMIILDKTKEKLINFINNYLKFYMKIKKFKKEIYKNVCVINFLL